MTTKRLQKSILKPSCEEGKQKKGLTISIIWGITFSSSSFFPFPFQSPFHSHIPELDEWRVSALRFRTEANSVNGGSVTLPIPSKGGLSLAPRTDTNSGVREGRSIKTWNMSKKLKFFIVRNKYTFLKFLKKSSQNIPRIRREDKEKG